MMMMMSMLLLMGPLNVSKPCKTTYYSYAMTSQQSQPPTLPFYSPQASYPYALFSTTIAGLEPSSSNYSDLLAQ